MKSISLSFFLCLTIGLYGQRPHAHTYERAISFPDVPGYYTLACDFHIHTVFSDGSVWPNIRVQEAIRDGLDAISLTEHLEYQPHLDDIPHPNRNRSHEIARQVAKDNDLIVVQGAEVTRDMPPGHCNAIFIKDANKLMDEDPTEVFKEVKKQGGFVFWDHPNWTSQRADGIATLTDMHRNLIREGLLRGIEVVNDLTYSDEALQIALDQDLTIMGTSDIHGLVDWQFDIPEGGHRPVTLIFAEERSEAGIQGGLQARRTIAYFNDLLIGKEENLKSLIEACLRVKDFSYHASTLIASIEIENMSSADFMLKNQSNFSFHGHADVVQVPANTTVSIDVKTIKEVDEIKLSWEVLNGIIAPNTHPTITFDIKKK